MKSQARDSIANLEKLITGTSKKKEILNDESSQDSDYAENETQTTTSKEFLNNNTISQKDE